jgi:TldD protein
MDIKRLIKHLDCYGEIREQKNIVSALGLSNGALVSNSKSLNQGFSARAYKGKEWGFSSTSIMNEEEAKRAIEKAQSNASYLQRMSGNSDLLLPSRITTLEKDLRTTKNLKSIKEKIEFIEDINNRIKTKYPELASVMLYLSEDEAHKEVATVDGSYFKTIIPRTHLRVMMMLNNDGQMLSEGDVFGGLGNFEDLFTSPDELEARIEEAYSHLVNKKSAIFAKAGEHEVILGPDLAGILAHEAIGHTTEADLVRNGSITANLMNERIASDMVNLIDVPHTYNGKLCPRPVFVDDEGVEPVTANIIENGILKSYMHNKESAQIYGVQPTGNARASQYSDEPIIRMRNTMIVPGTSKLDDMIKTVKDGYYLMLPSNGQADSTSEFMFGVSRGYEIKNGKLGNAIKETTISGVAVELLKTVTDISDDLKWLGSGMCGKKQSIPVGMGGPAIKCSVNIGGK